MNNPDINLDRKISVGYNREGQQFFDFLNGNHNYIHSYFFSPTYDFTAPIDWQTELALMKNIDTYGIEGNILFNLQSSLANRQILKEFLKLDNLHIEAVTVLDQQSIRLLKKVKEDLKFHISVNVNINSIEELREKFDLRDLYCININHKHIFNTKLINDISMEGIKIKLIPNEMCMWDRNQWASYMFNRITCPIQNGLCKRGCYQEMTGQNSWLNLTRQGFTKEFLPFFNNKLDIIKLSTRATKMDSLSDIFYSFVDDRNPKYFSVIQFRNEIPIEFIQKRFDCTHECKECNFCKDVYDNYCVTPESKIFV